MTSERPTDPHEELLATALQLLHEHRGAGLEDLLQRHPEHAEAVRRELQLLDSNGMIDLPAPGPTVPERLGEFHLRGRLGGGGMGVVYRAEQPSLRRRVALKVIRPEQLYFPHARERFDREVAAIARLQHPAIVRVHSAGAEGPLPYFTMELVEGVSLDRLLTELATVPATERCEASVREALRRLGGGDHVAAAAAAALGWTELCCRWLRDLADAVDYAHGQGVLHRDIKPSNVMITWSLRPMLLDFGLASIGPAAMITQSGAQLGSVPYMAPEQVRGEAHRIDRRTDVYALGVVLYELLTLHHPFRDHDSSDDQTRRRIVAAEAAPVRQRNPRVSWDAETVCHRAMAQEPEQRYQDARALAQDLDNLLQLRPIAARPAGAAVRLRRWIRRRPTAAVAVVLGALLLLLAPTAYAVSEHLLRQQIAAAKETADREAQARADILQFFDDEVLAAVAPDAAGRDATMRQVLDRAAGRIAGRFDGRPLVEAAVRSTIGDTYRRLGALDEAEQHLLRAVELHRQHAGPGDRATLATQRRLGILYSAQGRYADEEALLRQVLATTRSAFGPDDPDTLAAQNNLGLLLTRRDQHDEALRLLQGVVDARLQLLGEQHEDTQVAMSNLGIVLYNMGRYADAEPWVRRELELCRARNGDDHPSTLISRQNLANLLTMQGRMEDGLQQMQAVVQSQLRVLGPEHQETLSSMWSESRMLAATGRHDQALAALEQVIGHATHLPDDNPLRLRAQVSVAEELRALGRLDEAAAASSAAIAACDQALGVDSQLAVLARAYRARLCIDRGDREAADDLMRQALQQWTGGDTAWLTEIRVARGRNLRQLGRAEAAAAELQRAAGFRAAADPDDRLLGGIYDELAAIASERGDADSAARWQAAAGAWDQRRQQRAGPH